MALGPGPDGVGDGPDGRRGAHLRAGLLEAALDGVGVAVAEGRQRDAAGQVDHLVGDVAQVQRLLADRHDAPPPQRQARVEEGTARPDAPTGEHDVGGHRPTFSRTPPVRPPPQLGWIRR